MSPPSIQNVSVAQAAAVALRASHAATLGALLSGIPKVKTGDVPAAVTALMDAADQYKASVPIVDKADRRSRPTISGARAAVKNLDKTLEDALDQLGQLPINAVTALTDAQAAPLGKLRADLTQICAITKAAFVKLNSEPDKAADHARNILACDVAAVFRDILTLSPSATRDTAIAAKKSRGGAAYARVLRATLVAAGVTQNVDIGPLIDSGRRLLADPEMPHNL